GKMDFLIPAPRAACAAPRAVSTPGAGGAALGTVHCLVRVEFLLTFDNLRTGACVAQFFA
ncbi:hypothetical protein A2U01_0033893, partial [Trifolium medium]|nr:hypothetical protein [Trifolium medium]